MGITELWDVFLELISSFCSESCIAGVFDILSGFCRAFPPAAGRLLPYGTFSFTSTLDRATAARRFSDAEAAGNFATLRYDRTADVGG